MTLACQLNSYLKTIKTNVKSITSITNDKSNYFEVILEDTILFPEGGGQPDDQGKIDGFPVNKVFRRGKEAIHKMLDAPFYETQEVFVEVDWQRRWDHMQQHSAQHLISALAESIFNFKTTSWNLGSNITSIEFDTKEILASEVEKLECLANDNIKECCRMYPIVYQDKNAPEIRDAKCRGLPMDHEGPVRVMIIDGVDTNLCCGTHVSNLSHLQAIKFLDVEKGKKDKVILTFIAGERVLNYISNAHAKEKKLTSLLKGGVDDHLDLLQKIQTSLKISQKNNIILLKDVAKYEAELFNMKNPKQSHFFLHKKEGNNEFMNLLNNEILDKNVLVFLSVGEDTGAGLFLITGQSDFITKISPKILEILDGKGACKDGRLQGKANKIHERQKAEKYILENLY